MPRGGYRKPEKPAAVSGPGALSQRTDRGQPIRVPTGQPYGDRQAMTELQQAAPMANGPSAIPAGGGGGAAGGAPPPTMPPEFGDIFSMPSTRPNEPITAGAPVGPGPNSLYPILGDDPDEALQALYDAYPHPDIRELLERRMRL